MTTDLTTTNAHHPMQWTDAQRDLIIQQFGLHEASDHEVAYFFEVARRTGADPLRRQIHAQMRNDKRAGRKVLTIIHGIDWYRKQAALSGDYAGSDDAVFTGTTADGNPALATVTVYKIVQGHRVAFTASARWEEYADRTYNGDDYKGLWKSKPHVMLAKCFDDKTEVLTDRGFRRFADITTERVMQVGETKLEAVDAKPFAQPYTGPMIGYESDDINFLVTPNHDMVTTLGKIEARAMYATQTARRRWLIPRIASHDRADNPRWTDEQLKLAAIITCDGNRASGISWRVAVSRKYKIDAIESLVLHASRHKVHCGGTESVAPRTGRIVRTNFDKIAYSFKSDLVAGLLDDDKLISCDEVLTLSRRQARIIADTMLIFDGHENRKTGVRRLYSSSPETLDAFELVCAIAGYSVSGRTARRDEDSSKPNYRIGVSDRTDLPVHRWGEGYEGRPSLRYTPYSGSVWCVTVPSGQIIVRRNGFSMICGNCAEAQSLRKGWPEQLAGTYVEEELATLTTHEPLTITPDQAAIIRTLGDAAGASGQAWEQKALTRPAEAWETTAGAAVSAVEAAHNLDDAQIGQLTMLVANGSAADVQDWLDENTVTAGVDA